MGLLVYAWCRHHLVQFIICVWSSCSCARHEAAIGDSLAKAQGCGMFSDLLLVLQGHAGSHVRHHVHASGRPVKPDFRRQS